MKNKSDQVAGQKRRAPDVTVTAQPAPAPAPVPAVVAVPKNGNRRGGGRGKASAGTGVVRAKAQKSSSATTATSAAKRETDRRSKKRPRTSFAPAPATIRSAWHDHFNVLAKFAQEKGHARVAQRLDTEQYPKLGNWVANQRRAYRLEKLRQAGKDVRGGGRINAEQIKLLESIPGFRWVASREPSDHKGSSKHRAGGPPPEVILPAWRRNYEALKKFRAEFGHARVPVSLDTAEYPKLGSWVHVQRRAYRLEKLRRAGEPWKGNNRINAEQIRMLEELGFEWAPSSRRVFVFQCERDCGFTGSFKNVKIHEASCQHQGGTSANVRRLEDSSASTDVTASVVAASSAAATDAAADPKIFQCEHDCGFEGTFKTVEKHERTCSRRPASGAEKM